MKFCLKALGLTVATAVVLTACGGGDGGTASDQPTVGVDGTIGDYVLPAGYVIQGGLTWTPNITTVGGWYGAGRVDWNMANTYCTTAINGLTGWRLPTQFELKSLYSSGAAAGQPGWTLDYTWSSASVGAGFHYDVSLNIGIVGTSNDASYSYVSCVR